MNTKRPILLYFLYAFAFSSLSAQEIFLEASGTTSDGNFSPLWLSSNRQGIISPYSDSSYERVGLHGSFTLGKDSVRGWRFSYCADIMASQNALSDFFIHQMYLEIRKGKVTVVVGQKERNIELRNDTLTSGGLSQGINSRPLPGLYGWSDYFSIPGVGKWLQVRGHLGVGRTTDGKWQESWVNHEQRFRYTSNTLLLEKSICFKIAPKRWHLKLEPSLQMMTQFGGTSYNALGRNHEDPSKPIHHSESLKAFWQAFCHIGSEDVTDGNHPNSAGNTVGSYNIALTWQDKGWMARAYFERFFEDQSMLSVQYGVYDHLLGLEVALPKNPFLSGIVVEHLSTKDQAGPVYHDFTQNIPESYTGMDDYYNHNLYTGWQHWGMAIGNPLLTSPIYNYNHKLMFQNNRVQAWHIGLQGSPCENLHWRFLATATRNWGTYVQPFDDVVNTQHYLVEASYLPSFLSNWKMTIGLGVDRGKTLGNSVGLQCTLRRSFILR